MATPWNNPAARAPLGLLAILAFSCSSDSGNSPADGGDGDTGTTADAADTQAEPDAGEPDIGADSHLDTPPDPDAAPDATPDATPDTADEPNPTFTVGGRATGVRGDSVFLRNGGADDLPLPAGHSDFVFPTPLTDGESYEVTVHGVPADAQCDVSAGSGEIAGADVTDVSVTCIGLLAPVAPLYPTHGADWNDYLENDGRTRLEASDLPCPTEPQDGHQVCLHGGELRVVAVPEARSCRDLSATDDAGAFVWECDDSDGVVRFVSTGLQAGAGLADLLDFGPAEPAWRPLAVTVWRGDEVLAATPATVWWGNPVSLVDPEAATDQTLELSESGHVYAVTEDPAVTIALVEGEGIALVAAPDVIMTGALCCTSVVWAAIPRVWVEGRIEKTVNHTGVVFSGVRHGVLNNVVVTDSPGTLKAPPEWDPAGVHLESSNDNRLVGITSLGSPDGVSLAASSFNRLERLELVGGAEPGQGLSFDGDAESNRVRDVVASGFRIGVIALGDQHRLDDVTVEAPDTPGFAGVFLGGAGHHLTDLSIAGAGYPTGVWVSGADDNVLIGLEIDGPEAGLVVEDATNNYLARAWLAHGSRGVHLTGDSTGNQLVDVVTAHHEAVGLWLDDGASANRIRRLTASNVPAGVILEDAPSNVLEEVLVAHAGAGIEVGAGAHDNLLARLTIANIDGIGLYVHEAGGNAVTDSVVLNAETCVTLFEDTYTTFANLAVNFCNTSLYLSSSDHSYFTGDLIGDPPMGAIPNPGDWGPMSCDVTGGETPGVTDLCAPGPGSRSDYTLYGLRFAESFYGRTGPDDGTNPQGGPGVTSESTILDWVHFDTRQRVWGLSGGLSHFGPNHRGPCEGTVSCTIWDWQLVPEDTRLRDRLVDPATADEDDALRVAHRSSAGLEVPFLRNTVEVPGLEGDDDGLCESGERCLFVPHLGASQGDGNPVPGLVTLGGYDGPTLTNIGLLANNGSRRVDALRRVVPGSEASPGTLVAIEVTVTHVTWNGFYAEDAEPGAGSGVFVFMPGEVPPNLAPGARVAVYGEVAPFRGMFEIEPLAVAVIAHDDPPLPAVVDAELLNPNGSAGEELESRLVSVEDVYVTGFVAGSPAGSNADAFWVSQEPGAACGTEAAQCTAVSDFLLDGADPDNDQPAVEIGQHLSAVTGLVNGFDSLYRLDVRRLADIVPAE